MRALRAAQGFCTAAKQTIEKDVLIVGGGPAGLVLSNLLNRMSVSSILVESSPTPSTHPQAHFINTRTMEILRELGV